MNYQEECIFRYRRLLELLEEERQDIPNCFEGKMAEIYRSVLKEEENAYRQQLRNVQQIISI